MGLTPDKETLLQRLNQQAVADFEAARERAIRAGKPIPQPPVPLEPEHIEYPKWMYNAKGGAKLVKSQGEQSALGAGWAEAPPKG